MKQYNAERFFSSVRERVGPLNQGQVDGFNVFLEGFSARKGVTDENAAYVLATAWHEVDKTMLPIRERGSRTYIERLYDPCKGSSKKRRARARRMGNTKCGDGWKYRGGGYPQLTWGDNYLKLGQRIGLGRKLYEEPELILQPDIAFAVTWEGMYYGLFTGVGMPKYLSNPEAPDWYNCRRVVNGTDRADTIAGYATDIFLPTLKAAA